MQKPSLSRKQDGSSGTETSVVPVSTTARPGVPSVGRKKMSRQPWASQLLVPGSLSIQISIQMFPQLSLCLLWGSIMPSAQSAYHGSLCSSCGTGQAAVPQRTGNGHSEAGTPAHHSLGQVPAPLFPSLPGPASIPRGTAQDRDGRGSSPFICPLAEIL